MADLKMEQLYNVKKEPIVLVGHAKATYMSNGGTVEETIINIKSGMSKTYTGTNITAQTALGMGKIEKVYGTADGVGALQENETYAVEVISQNGEQQVSNITYLDKPLCVLKDAKQNIVAQDVLSYKDKKVYRQCGYFKLNGTESWERKAFGGKYYFRLSNTSVQASDFGKCNKLTFIESTKSIVDYANSIRCTSGIVDISLDFADLSLESFKTWLASNNVVLVYKLTETLEENADCTDKIQQFDGETTVYCTDNVEIEVTLSNNKAIAEINGNIAEVEENSTRNVITLSNTTEQAIAQTTGTTVILDNIVVVGNKLSANNNSVVVGSGVRKVLISANLNLQDLTASKSLQLALQQNNASGQAKKILKAHAYSSGALGFLNIGNVLLDVEEGDSFSLLTYNGCAGKVRSASNGATNITVEVVE